MELLDFAARLREYRKGEGWTQSEMAEEWGYSFETISAWERRKRTPSRSELPRLAQLLGMEEQELVSLVKPLRQVGGSMASRSVQVSHVQTSSPFVDGQLLWSLHIGLGTNGLQCVISRPGQAWEIALDPVTDFEDIQAVYQLVNSQVCLKTRKQQTSSNVVSLSRVV